MNTYASKYTFGNIVYLKTDPDQGRWMVVEILFMPNSVMYHLRQGEKVTTCYEIEISDEIDETIKLGLTQNKES